MLRELHISGLGVIDDLDLPLHPGLNVLTGETGAGKTMITVGLALALGGRASASLVRDGATAARVQALFDVGHDAAQPSRSRWAEDGEVCWRGRSLPRAKGRLAIGGQLATASALVRARRGARRGARAAPGAAPARAGRCRRRSSIDSPATLTSWRSPPTARRSTASGRRWPSSNSSARQRAIVNASSICSPIRCARSRP